VNGTLVASGSAAGPAQFSLDSQSNFAPVAQLGYFRHFGDSSWLWGGKFSYSYLGTTSTKENLIIPQAGSSSDTSVSSFSGNSVTRSYKVSIYHQTTLMPFVGHSFDKSFLYLGAGPSLSQVQTSLNDVVGFADINGTRTDISGAPQSFSFNQWMFGAAATAGITYFLAPSWFLDLSYSFVMPNAQTGYVTSPFNNPRDSGPSFTGTLIGAYTASLSSHALTLTINKAF
jgi:opacity protein-like surface antigen